VCSVQSRDISVSIAVGYGLDGQGSIPGRGKILLLSITSRLGLGSTQSPIQWVPGAVTLGVKRQEREVDHSLPSCVQVKNGGAIPPLPIRLYDVVLNELSTRDNFTFFNCLFSCVWDRRL
jgi:hypothetical protein